MTQLTVIKPGSNWMRPDLPSICTCNCEKNAWWWQPADQATPQRPQTSTGAHTDAAATRSAAHRRKQAPRSNGGLETREQGQNKTPCLSETIRCRLHASSGFTELRMGASPIAIEKTIA